MQTKQLAAIKLAVFDYDGTITYENKAGIAEPALQGLRAMRSAGIVTTTITARPYQRLLSLSGGIENISSAGAPLATERGARIVGADKTENLHYYPLTYREHEIIANMPMANVDFIGFYPEDLYGTSYIWTPEEDRKDKMTSRYGHDAIIQAGSKNSLRTALNEARPCLVTIRFKTPDASNKLALPDDLNTAWGTQTVSLVLQGVDKFSALQAICSSLSTSFNNTLYAGNDSNDIPVLSLRELGMRILVGDYSMPSIANPYKRVASPDLLGEYLEHITGEI